MRDIGIDRIMTENPSTIGPDASVAEARDALRLNSVHHLPVAEDGKLVGIVSASDVLNRMLVENNSALLASIPVRRFMEHDPVVLTRDATLRDAALQLSGGAFHSLPVVGPDRTLVGIVTTSDLIQYLLQRLPIGAGPVPNRDEAAVAAADVTEAMTSVVRAAASGALPEDAAKTIARLHERSKALEAVVDAAQRYIRSGHADHEHTALVRRLSELRDVDSPLGL